jgi:hypothetical protein
MLLSSSGTTDAAELSVALSKSDAIAGMTRLRIIVRARITAIIATTIRCHFLFII